ncbi:MAG TPA: DICT sensory domain-containing protein, partial [Chroococcidiopsis sp.]
MTNPTSVLAELLEKLPQLRAQLYFKPSLTALSHAMEDQVLAGGSGQPLVIASFQRERFYRQEAHRYLRIAELTPQVYVLAAPETNFTNSSEHYEMIAFDADDQLSQEWHLVVLGQQFASCLVCRERQASPAELAASQMPVMDQNRRFEGVWTFDRQVSCQAAEILLNRIQVYRPELTDKIAQAKRQFLADMSAPQAAAVDTDPFAQRLITYLQAGQYKLLKAYRSISAQERRERLINLITSAIRRSLNPEEIFSVAVRELGQAMGVCRCLIYRCRATDLSTTIEHEFLADDSLLSLIGQTWPLDENPLFQAVVKKHESIAIADTANTDLPEVRSLQSVIERWQIHSWLLVPVVY